MDSKKSFEGLNLNENLIKGIYLYGFTSYINNNIINIF